MIKTSVAVAEAPWREFGQQVLAVDPDREPAVEAAELPSGWTAIQQRPHAWSLIYRGEFVCDLELSLVGEWRLCLPGEFLPRPQAYVTPARAVAALLRLSPLPARKPSPRPREHPTPYLSSAPTPRPVLSSYFRQLHPRPTAKPDRSRPGAEPPLHDREGA